MPLYATYNDLKNPSCTPPKSSRTAGIYGVVRASNDYMGQKCHCHQRTFQRHVVKLEQAHILKKTVVKKVVRIRIGDRIEARLRNEINTYTPSPFRGTRPLVHLFLWTEYPGIFHSKAGEKNSGVRKELDNQRKGIRFLTPGTDLWQKVSEEITRLEELVAHGPRRIR